MRRRSTTSRTRAAAKRRRRSWAGTSPRASAGYGEFRRQIKSGKLRALAISSDKRVPGIDIPTLKEQGIDVELANWRGIFGAPGITDAQRKELIDVGRARRSRRRRGRRR